MNNTPLRRRELLVAVTAGYGTVAGCSEISAVRSGYGTAYGYGYGTD